MRGTGRGTAPTGSRPVRDPRGESSSRWWVRRAMTENPQTHDQDADPPTPDGEEPDVEQLRPGSEPAGDPDPAPGADDSGA